MTELRVLLVEDDDTDALILSEVASHASGGERIAITREVRLSEAIERTRTETFDVVLLDLGLPDAQGLETFLRYTRSCPQLPVVVLTGTSDGEVTREAVEAGAQDFIVKGELVHVPLTRVLRYAVERARLHADLRASELRFRALVELADDALSRTMLLPGRRVEYVSPAIESLTGFPAERFLEDPGFWRSRVHPADLPSWDNRRRLADGAADWVVYRCRKPDDTWVWLEDRRVPILDDAGRLTAFQAITRDVTAREQMENALSQALEQERAALEKLRVLDSMRATFLQAVSHELRTPLTVVRGFALTLQQHVEALAPERRRDLLDRLVSGVDRLERLLGDLLDIDRINRGRVAAEREETDVTALVDRVVDVVGAREHPVSVSSRVSRPFFLDAAKVERIVENLLRNAVKHTPPGTPIRIEADGDDDRVLITVTDHGPGIAPEIAEDIFEPFVQGTKSRDNPSPGTGIGLSLVARFAELHEGRAWVEPTPGGGATFRVHLPAPGRVAPTDLPARHEPVSRPELVVAETVRELLHTSDVEEIPVILAIAVDRLGGTTLVGAEDSPMVLPLDLSVGVGPTVMPAAPIGSRAREVLEAHLPQLVEDARRAADRCRAMPRVEGLALPRGVESSAVLRGVLEAMRPGDAVIELRFPTEDGLDVGELRGRIGSAVRGCLRALDRVFLVEPLRFVVVLPEVTEMAVASVLYRLEEAAARCVPDVAARLAVRTVGSAGGVSAYREVREQFAAAG